MGDERKKKSVLKVLSHIGQAAGKIARDNFPGRVGAPDSSPGGFRRVDLERLDRNLFRASPKDLWLPQGARGVFGGQVIGQSLWAASKSVDESKELHSLHSYFLRAGKDTMPIIYSVQTLRDGKSFSVKLVTATQDGRPIFMLQASFQKPEPSRLNHSKKMPSVPKPSDLPTERQRLLGYANHPHCPPNLREFIKERAQRYNPIDMRLVKGTDFIKGVLNGVLKLDEPKRPNDSIPTQIYWIKAKERLPDDPNIHRSVLAYASDLGLVATARGDISPLEVKMIASLDHSMWFHKKFRADEWLLYVMESPRASSARGLTLGTIYKPDGTLVVSVAQEGVIRVQPKL